MRELIQEQITSIYNLELKLADINAEIREYTRKVKLIETNTQYDIMFSAEYKNADQRSAAYNHKLTRDKDWIHFNDELQDLLYQKETVTAELNMLRNLFNLALIERKDQSSSILMSV